MCADHKQPPSDDDQELNQLLSEANQIGGDTFTRPSDEVIESYLLGHASKSQTDEVRHALLLSSEFRHELATLTGELASIDSSRVKKDLESIPNGAVPDLSSFVSGAYAEESQRTQRQRGFGGVVNTLFRPRRAAAFVFVILIIVSFALMQDDHLPLGKLSLVRQQVAPDDIIRLSPREVGVAGQSTAYETAELAALAGFRSSLDYRNGEFVIETESINNWVPSKDAKVLLRLKPIDGGTPDIEGMLPSDSFKDGQSVSVWLLLLPDRKLYMAEISTQELQVEVSEHGELRGLAAFIWFGNGSYHIGSVREF